MEINCKYYENQSNDFRKGGRLRNNISFTYAGESIAIVSKFVYRGTVFTTEGSFSEAQETLAGQLLKAIV